MAARRVAFLLGLAAALAIGVSLRRTTRAQLSATGRTRVLGSDDAYHLRRARFAVAHFPRTIFFDPLMNVPEGGVPIWPPLFDLALAAPSRALHGPAAPGEVVEAEAAWVPVVLAGAAIILAGAIGRRLYGPTAGVAAALFVAICPAHILWTQFGHTDQHVAESATGLLVLAAFLKSREEERSRNDVLAGLALALAVLSWQGAIYWAAIFALALFGECLLLRRDVLRPILLVLALPAVITAAATAAWLGPIRPPITYVSFGFFQPLFLGALAAGTLLLSTIAAAVRRELAGRALLVRIALLAAAAAVLLPFAGDLARGLANGLGYVVGRTREAAGKSGYVSYPAGWLKGIFEARPLLADGVALPLEQLSAAFFLSPLIVVLWASRVRRGPRAALHLALAIWGAVTIFLAVSQRLNVYYAAPLAAFAAIEAVRTVGTGIANAGARREVRAVFVAATAFLLILPMASGLRAELAAVRAPGTDLFETLDWMRKELPRTVNAYDPRLLDTPPDAPGLARAASVLAPWSLGHRILFDAEQPVVANNFGYGFEDSIRFFLAESEEEALAIARAHRARWILATDLAPRLNDYAGYIGRAPVLHASPAGGLAPTPEYFRSMQSRLYDFDGAGARLPGLEVPPLTRIRLVHASRTGIVRGGRWLARWKVFEILPD
ncbi:MAG TPA: STT3 domain-containing protein [Thermoanaerobaculia bacterium]